MSVVVSGMKIPETCHGCPMSIINWVYSKLKARNVCAASREELFVSDFREKRPAHCPLIELPEKHGRLIDADKLEWYQISGNVSVGGQNCGDKTFMLVNARHINELPTVLDLE